MSTSIMSNATISAVGQEEHLAFPVVTVYGPALREDYHWTISEAPGLIVDVDLVLRRHKMHSVIQCRIASTGFL